MQNKAVSFLLISFTGKGLIIVIVLLFYIVLKQLNYFLSLLYLESFKLCQWHRFGVFSVKLEHISDFFLMFTAGYEQLDACWNWSINLQIAMKTVKIGHLQDLNKVSALEGAMFWLFFISLAVGRKFDKRNAYWKRFGLLKTHFKVCVAYTD